MPKSSSVSPAKAENSGGSSGKRSLEMTNAASAAAEKTAVKNLSKDGEEAVEEEEEETSLANSTAIFYPDLTKFSSTTNEESMELRPE
jgi:hypothetical protein